MALCPDSRWARTWPGIAPALLALVTSASALDLSKWPGREAAIEQARSGQAALAIHVSAEFAESMTHASRGLCRRRGRSAGRPSASRFVPAAGGGQDNLRLKRTDKARRGTWRLPASACPTVVLLYPRFCVAGRLAGELSGRSSATPRWSKLAYEQPLAVRRHRAESTSRTGRHLSMSGRRWATTAGWRAARPGDLRKWPLARTAFDPLSARLLAA
jgi:hypothetical protein